MAKKPNEAETPEPNIEQPRPPLPPIAVSPIPVVIPRTPETIINPSQPLDECYLDGIFICNSGGAKGEEFALCIAAEDGYGKTHFCKNSVHFWSGTETEFKLQFDKP